MRKNLLKEKLSRGEVVFGLFGMLPSPAVVEMAGMAGFDFVVIDGEHSIMSYETVEAMVRAADIHDLSTIMRVPEPTQARIQLALETGAMGIMVPQVSDKSVVEQVVQYSRYAPQGMRGINTATRASNYGTLTPQEYVADANREVLVSVQIEGGEGVRNAADIVRVEGLDLAFIGPSDLSLSMGLAGQMDHPKLVEMIEQTVAEIRSAGLPAGIYADTQERAERWIKAGVQFIAYGCDSSFISAAFHDIVSTTQEIAERCRNTTQ